MNKLKDIKIGIIFGIFAGITDVIPMLIQKLSWDADVSAFSMWVISGFLIATSSLKMNNALKGLLISTLTFIPAGFLIAAQEPVSLIPISVFLVILGSSLGYFIGKYTAKEG
jgi:hypothetical protein